METNLKGLLVQRKINLPVHIKQIWMAEKPVKRFAANSLLLSCG